MTNQQQPYEDMTNQQPSYEATTNQQPTCEVTNNHKQPHDVITNQCNENQRQFEKSTNKKPNGEYSKLLEAQKSFEQRGVFMIYF